MFKFSTLEKDFLHFSKSFTQHPIRTILLITIFILLIGSLFIFNGLLTKTGANFALKPKEVTENLFSEFKNMPPCPNSGGRIVVGTMSNLNKGFEFRGPESRLPCIYVGTLNNVNQAFDIKIDKQSGQDY